MKKIIVVFVVVVAVLSAGGYFLYRALLPEMIAEAVTSESLPAYVPKRFQSKVDAIRVPLNKGTEAMIEEMHASDIPIERVLSTVDNVSEKEAYAFLDELNNADPQSTNEVFDIAKRHFETDFDPEVFREPFNKHFKIRQIRDGMAYANTNRRTNDIDVATAKAILKKIILEKEKEVRREQADRSTP